MSAQRPEVVFVDLDGTLSLENSFHLLVRELFRYGTAGTRLALFLAAVARVVGPGRGRLRMKQRVLRLHVRQAPDSYAAVVDAVVDAVCRSLSQPVLEYVERSRAAGATAVLATAASSTYAHGVAERLGLDFVLATEVVDGVPMSEMLGETKAAACRRWLDERNWTEPPHVVVISDHADDLPLFALADVAVVQGPRQVVDTVTATEESPSVVHIDPAAAEAEGAGLWIFLDDVARGPFDSWEVRTVLSKHRYALLYVGDGEWRRIRPGADLRGATLRRNCPSLPTASQRISISLRRRLVRDGLGVFH